MNRIVKSTLVAASALALGAIALPAAARSSVAFMGRAQFPAEAGCFVESFGTMINNCSSMTRLIIPLIMDPGASNNYLHATVTAYAASMTGLVQCASFGVNSASGAVWGGAMQDLPALGSRQDIVLPGAYFNSDSTAYVACFVGPGGQVNQVRY
ncbi:hypothetical protein BE04_44270 [Sorangium cellulosum]|uniref:Secreted protein n=2 Tax=Sorangium cellulosum TaxID=56 RepID=A0A150PB25_SORCE|nr:hypothetical protein [Sorangium cellulosum]AGP40474.1 hypothetical protein SCE1572_41820 [Sorangium cellulosum So0157-2]KYF52875.1 hypothetical protein BE04_44270 [Sorangium cellulosum]